MNAGHDKVGAALAEESHGATPISLTYGLESKPKPLPLALFSLQHVMIMFGAMVASPIVIGQLLNLSADYRAALITGVMFGCGVGTIVSALGVAGIGGRLPLLLGAYTANIVPIVSITKAEGLPAASAAVIIGGAILLLASPIIGKLRSLFPPLVVGALLVVTGFSLIKVVSNIALATNTPYAGQAMPIVLLIVSIVLIVGINRFAKGVVRSLSIFIALAIVYGITVAFGASNTAPLTTAPWFRLPTPIPFGMAWPSIGAVGTVLIYYFIAAVYTMSITVALCRIVDTPATESRVRGAIAADGFGSLVATLFGGVPLISYDQNVGAITLTGVGSRFVVATSGAILILMAFVPKVGALFSIVPPFVLGGTLIFMFGMIISLGIGILSSEVKNQRGLLIVAATVGLSAMVSFAPEMAFAFLPATVRILVSDGIVVGTFVAVLLNVLWRDSAPPTA